MADAPAHETDPAVPVGQKVTAWGWPDPSGDDPELRPGPFTGELSAVRNPFTTRVEYWVDGSLVDVSTVARA